MVTRGAPIGGDRRRRNPGRRISAQLSMCVNTHRPRDGWETEGDDVPPGVPDATSGSMSAPDFDRTPETGARYVFRPTFTLPPPNEAHVRGFGPAGCPAPPLNRLRRRHMTSIQKC